MSTNCITSSHHSSISIIDYTLLAVLLGLAFYWGINSYAILDMNEGLYAEIAREMLVQHNFIIPHLNYVPYLEKPPLLYWLIALSYQVFGVTEFAARFVLSTCSVLACVSTVWFGMHIGQARAGWLAAIILASSLGFILIGRTVFFDPLLNLWIWLSLWCFYLWYQSGQRSYLRVAYVCLAAGLLTKGFVALVVPALIAIIFLLSESCGWRKRLQLIDGWGILLFFIVAAPWHVLATLKQPHFAWDYFINEQFYRFLDKRTPNDYHTGPIYFYLPMILVYLFPWCLLLPTLRKTSFKNPVQKFLGLCFLVPLVFYSISRAKGDYYMVVGIPPLALLLGIALAQRIEQGKVRVLKIIFLTLAGITLASLGVIFYANHVKSFHFQFLNKLKLPSELRPELDGFMWIVCSYISAASFLCFYRRWILLPIWAIAGFSILLVMMYLDTRQIQQNTYSQKQLADYLLRHASEKPVYLYQDFERLSSVLFYFHRRLPIIDSRSQDLYFGSHTPAAQGGFLTGNEFLTKVQQQPSYVVMRTDKIAEFHQLVGNRYILQEVFHGNRAVVFLVT